MGAPNCSRGSFHRQRAARHECQPGRHTWSADQVSSPGRLYGVRLRVRALVPVARLARCGESNEAGHRGSHYAEWDLIMRTMARVGGRRRCPLRPQPFRVMRLSADWPQAGWRMRVHATRCSSVCVTEVLYQWRARLKVSSAPGLCPLQGSARRVAHAIAVRVSISRRRTGAAALRPAQRSAQPGANRRRKQDRRGVSAVLDHAVGPSGRGFPVAYGGLGAAVAAAISTYVSPAGQVSTAPSPHARAA